MPVLDWSLPRKKSSLPKFYNIDVISMTDQDSFAAVTPDRPKHGTLRKIKSLNDLLDNDVDNQSGGMFNSGSGDISKSEVSPTERSDRITELWSDQLAQRGSKRSTGQLITSGFSTLSRRAGGGMEEPDINMRAVRVFLRNGTHKTVRTNPNTTCKEVLESVLKKLGLQLKIYQYGLYIQYAISSGRIAQDDEIIANVNPNTWDSVIRIYLCHRTEFSSAQTRSRCASFARDFLEIEQKTRSDSNVAYDIKEFTNVQKHVQVSTHRGRVTTVAVQSPSVKKDMVTNKLIAESFAHCWARANRQLNTSNEYIESGVDFKTVKTPERNKRKMSFSIGTINRSYTIERGKERRPALTKMLSTGSLETSSASLKSSDVGTSPLVQNVNMNSNNSNNNPLIPFRVGSMVNLHQHTSVGKCDVHPFAWPLEHSSSLPVIKISPINEEDDEIYSIPSVTSISQSDKSELLHKLSPFSSYSSLDLPRKDLHGDKTGVLSNDNSSYQSSRSPSPTFPNYGYGVLVSSRSLPTLATNEAINTTSDILKANKQPRLEFDTNRASTLLSTKKPLQQTLSPPPPLPPRKHSPTTYYSSTLPIKRSTVPKESHELTSNSKQDPKHHHDDRETYDTIGEMPKCKGSTKLFRRRSISLSDLRNSFEKKSLKLTSKCNMDSLRKATGMKTPGAKSRQVSHQKLVKQPEDYHNVSIKELMAIRAAVTSSNLHSSTRPNFVTITPKPPHDALKPPAIPKRHSSLLTSSSSDEEIILRYKRMSSDSLYSCQDIEMALDDDTNSKHGNLSICDTVSSPDDDTFCSLADKKTAELMLRQEAYPDSSGCVHNLPCSKPNHTYDHLDFNRSFNSNRAVSTADRKDVKVKVVHPSLVKYAEVSHEKFSFSANRWLASPSDSLYNKGVHFSHKEPKQEIFNKPYTILHPVIKSRHNKLRPRTTALKKPSCSHIYEDVDSDYDDIDDDEDDEDYVIMERKKASPVPPTPPPIPQSFPNNIGGFKTQQQQHINNEQRSVTKPQQITVSSVVQNSAQQTSQATRNPAEPQIKIMVGKTTKTRWPLNLQDELNSKMQTRRSDIHNARNAPPTIHGCHHDHCNTSTVSKQPAKETESSELETKFLAMKSTHNIRREMIEKAESKLAASNNTTKRIELHSYANMTKNFMVLKEENISQS